jgi:hypothetical protein
LRPGEETTASAELTANRRDKIYEAKAELRNCAGTILATATGKYLPIKDVAIPELLADIVGDTGDLF